LLLVISIGVKLNSPGPVFYRQVRVGWNNRSFTMLKFRSMSVDGGGAKSGAIWARPGENREYRTYVTLTGHFLYKVESVSQVFLQHLTIIFPTEELSILWHMNTKPTLGITK